MGSGVDALEAALVERRVGAVTAVAPAAVDPAVGWVVSNATTLCRVQIRTQYHDRTSRRHSRHQSC